MSDTFSVGELCKAVGDAVTDRFPDEVWVTGAISGLNRSGNGHVYFDLIEPGTEVGGVSGAIVPVALFAANRVRVNHILRKSGSVRMADGIEIKVKGRVAHYPPQGRVQLVMSLIDPAFTIGKMAMARQALLDLLAAEGLLNANTALGMPTVPLRVGLITSEGSAAHADFTHELHLAGYPFEIMLFDARVQGNDAVPSLVAGIEAAGAAAVDIVVVVRGGGARTDLAAFDAEPVARAIAVCPRPVIVGVGHETDRSVADEVALASTKTPTAAAGLLIDAVRAFDAEVEHRAAALVELARARLDAAEVRVRGDGNRLVVAANATIVDRNHHLDHAAATLDHGSTRALDRAEATIDGAERTLRALDPARLLAKGWSITRSADGTLVRSPNDVAPGTGLLTTTASGTLASIVSDAAPSDGASNEEP